MSNEGTQAAEAREGERNGPRGEVRFVAREESVRLRGALEAARLLVVEVGDPGPGARGRLAEVIDEAIECVLRDRGGAPPGIGASCDADAALSDQLYRIRQIGRVGLAIYVGHLGALVDARGAVEPEDGAAIRFLAGATRGRPLVLLLDVSNASIRLYGAPQSLGDALGSPSPAVAVAAEPSATRGFALTGAPSPRPRASSSVARVPAANTTDKAPAEQATSECAPALLADALGVLRAVSRAAPLSALERAFVEGYAPLRQALLDERLGSAGLSKADARSACAAFATIFARAYPEALPTFGVTGRHPRMIFDLFELAQRCARVHGARSTQVVIVDALRWDLGRKVRDRMARVLARRAVCVEEHALWSILPTTTAVQLDALTRGEDALRAPLRPEHETSIVRGRSLDVLRRTRVGHRDVVKLDLLEGRLREGGAGERERLDSLAEELTPILARYVASSPTRALVVIVGDHGFTFGDPDDVPGEGTRTPRDERAPTPPARQGGGSPDEVFVPFAAWLVGGVH